MSRNEEGLTAYDWNKFVYKWHPNDIAFSSIQNAEMKLLHYLRRYFPNELVPELHHPKDA